MNWLALIAIVVTVLPSVASAKDPTETANRWTCRFPVETSGEEPTGNHFGCRVAGCGRHSYKFVERPETYTHVRNFRIDFNSMNVSYEGATIFTRVAEEGIRRNTDYTLERMNEILNVKYRSVKAPIRILGKKAIESESLGVSHPRMSDSLVIVYFEESRKEVDHMHHFATNLLILHAGGTRIQWLSGSPFMYKEEKTMFAGISYGECEPA